MNRGGHHLIPLSSHDALPRPPRRFVLPLAVITVLSAVIVVAIYVTRDSNNGSGDDASIVDSPNKFSTVGQAAVAGDSSPGEQSLTTVIGASAAAVGSRVFLDMTYNGSSIGRLTLGLFDERAPKTVANFVALATGKGGPPVDGVPGSGSASYAGVPFHRVISDFMAQGGDNERGDGSGGKSIYPGGKFDDEPFITTHDGRGVLSMANSGPNTNGAQFFITFKATYWLDGKHVVFGRVVDGGGTLDAMEAVDTQGGSRPAAPLLIAACGMANE
ncbi:hypothetical protein MMPV_002820 [Pyropia vietnamensis]